VGNGDFDYLQGHCNSGLDRARPVRENTIKGKCWIMTQSFVDVSEYKTLEQRMVKQETVTNDMYKMVKEMHDVFIGSLGQTPLITRLSEVEKDITEIKEAHAKDRWLVMGGVSVLAFFFSIFGDMAKKVLGL